jgi:hypothetical protein
MKSGRRAAPVVLVALACIIAAPQAAGEMEDREYESTEAAMPKREIARRQREIEAEMLDESRRAEAARAAEETARLARAAELAARPYGIRLLEARCDTVCHGVDRFEQTRHSWLGWQAVILRMQYLNGATLDPGERADLARHLAAAQPASIALAAIEYAIPPVLLATPFLGWAGWRRWRKRKP